MKTITIRQQAVLDFIQSFINTHNMPPTRRDITDAFQYRSPNAADEHLKALAKKGFIKLKERTSRGIELLGPSSPYLPIVGTVAAGSPILSEENRESQSRLTPSLFRPKADYLLRVQGESMIDIGINDGDLLAVHKTTEVKNNQIVVARLDDQVTVKRFKRMRSSDRIHLIPENKTMEPIVVDESTADLYIEGIGVGLLRTKI